jgi:hypothetical protein
MTGSGTRLAPTDCAWEVVHGSGMVVVVCLVEGGAAADRDVEWLDGFPDGEGSACQSSSFG